MKTRKIFIITALIFLMFTAAGAETYESCGFSYEICESDDGEDCAEIVGYDPEIINGDVLVIPTEIDGYPVKFFSGYLFKNSNFKKCDLSAFPELSSGMFEHSQIEEVILSEEMEIIPEYTFFGCKNLKGIKIPNSVKTIKTYALSGITFEELVIPSGVESLGNKAIESQNLRKLIIEEGALSLKRTTEMPTISTPNLRELYLPKSMNEIGEYEFRAASWGWHGIVITSNQHPPVTIYGYSGTYAETYARQNALNFVAIDQTHEEDDTINVNAGVPLRRNIKYSMLYVTDSDDYYVWLGNVEMLYKYTYKMDFTFRRTDDEPFENVEEIAQRIRVNGEPIGKYGVVDNGRAISISYTYDALEANDDEFIPFHFETKMDKNGNLIITDFSGDEISDIIEFPSEIDGAAVKAIYTSLYFYDDSTGSSCDIKKIVISEGVYLLDRIFNPSKLETVVLPQTLEVLDSYCLQWAHKLENINLENVKIIDENAFGRCDSLKSVNLSSAELIHDNAFDEIENLTIYGAAGSEAERFAKKRGYTFIEIEVPEREEPTIREKTDKLYKLGLFKGVGTDENGNPDFAFFDGATRTEAVAMLVRMLGKEEEAENHAKTHPFTDVPEWADGYVSYAYENGLTNGISETVFDAEATVSHEMFLTFMLRALGYSDSGENADFDWENPWVIANENRITERAGSYGQNFDRYKMADMVYQTLFAKMKGTETPLFEKLIESGIFTAGQWNEA